MIIVWNEIESMCARSDFLSTIIYIAHSWFNTASSFAKDILKSRFSRDLTSVHGALVSETGALSLKKWKCQKSGGLIKRDSVTLEEQWVSASCVSFVLPCSMLCGHLVSYPVDFMRIQAKRVRFSKNHWDFFFLNYFI